jgi:hypothetical protein
MRHTKAALSCCILAGCSGPAPATVDASSTSDGAADGAADGDAGVDAPAGPAPRFLLGMCGTSSELSAYTTFRTANQTPGYELSLCHAYTYWDIAHHDPGTGNATHNLAGLKSWFANAQGVCDELLITFQGPQSTATDPPSVSAFEQAFLAFVAIPEFATWQGKLSFTAWNEPNNPLVNGNALLKSLSPELAAQYYLVLRKHCDPAMGCKVAAGDLATNGGFANDIEWNCADDNDPANTPTRCAARSSENPSNAPPSYLDRYKNYITLHAPDFGLPHGFRPEYFAYHPWNEVNAYLTSNRPCSTYQNCTTRRLLRSMGGTWNGIEIWDDEISVGLQLSTAPDEHTTQPCGAAFLVRLTELDSKIKRVYYMHYAGGNGPLLDGSTLRPAGTVMGTRSPNYAGAHCADTGM